MALALSTKAKIAAATLTAFSVMSGAFSANAQQMSANGTAPHQVSLSAKCAPIKDIADQTACEIIHRRAERLDQLRASTQAANAEGSCADQLKALRTRDPSIVDRGRVILAGRPLAEFGVCNLLGSLTRG